MPAALRSKAVPVCDRSDQLGRHGRQDGGVQVAPMQEQIGRAVALLGIREIEIRQMLARVPYTVGPGRRLEGAGAQVLLQTSARRTRIALELIWMPAPMRWNCLACSYSRTLAPCRDSSPAKASPPMPAPMMANVAVAVMTSCLPRGRRLYKGQVSSSRRRCGNLGCIRRAQFFAMPVSGSGAPASRCSRFRTARRCGRSRHR
jgi:hypothetical protein